MRLLDLKPMKGGPACLRNGRRQARSGRETLSSTQRKLARQKAAAGGSRRGYRMQEGERNSKHPWDFEERAPQHATARSPMVEHRASVNRSLRGRRTSLCGWVSSKNCGMRATLSAVYPDRVFDAMAITGHSWHPAVLRAIGASRFPRSVRWFDSLEGCRFAWTSRAASVSLPAADSTLPLIC